MSKRISLLVVVLSILLIGALHAQTEPATTSFALPEGPIKVTVTGVQGIVQYRTGADQKWTKAAEGVELTEGAELRTGPRSAVRFMIGDDQVVTLDRLGTIQILKANFANGKVFTDLGMKYGRTRYDIESAAREHDAKVRSPSSVLAVRGTQFALDDEAPFPPTAVSLSGRVMFQDAHKLVAFGAKGKGKAKIDTDSDSSADTALKTTVVLPNGKFFGYTDIEASRTLENSLGGYAANAPNSVASLVHQGTIQNFPVPVLLIQEQLFFGLNWTGSGLSDVSLQVTDPNGQVINKANPMIPGFAAYQDAPPANAVGVGGPKTVTWGSIFPPGTYTITTSLISEGVEPVPVNVSLDAIKDPTGQANDFAELGPNGGPFIYSLDPKNPTKTVTVDAEAKPPAPPTPPSPPSPNPPTPTR